MLPQAGIWRTASEQNALLYAGYCRSTALFRGKKIAFCSVVSLCFACLSVDGIWEVWGSWTECSRPCGTGEQIRSRNCVGPFYEGRDCQGDWNETKSCNTHSCAGRMSIVVLTFEESQWVRHTQCVFGFAVKWLSHFLTVFLIETYWTISENQSTDF